MEMRWIAVNGNDGEKILHLRSSPVDKWKPYTEFPEYLQPDTLLGGIQTSKGFRTAQYCLSKGIKYV